MYFWISCSITFSGIKLLGLQFPKLSLFPFLKTGVTFAFLQSLGISPSEWSKITRSGLTMTSASSLNTCGCISSGSMDLLMSSLLLCSPTWSSPDRATSFLFQSSSWSLEIAFLKAGHDNKVGGKDSINQAPCLVRQWSHIFFSLTFVSHILIEAFLVFEISVQIQFHLSFSLIPGFSMFLYSSYLLVLASTLCMFPFCVWVLLGSPC